jgi:restriction system protein
MSHEFDLPKRNDLMNPLIEALHQLGGSGTIDEINNEVAEIMGLSDEQLEVPHNPERSAQTEFEYRLAWTRTYLKKYGILENSRRGVWAIDPEARNIREVDPVEVVKHYQQQSKKTKKKTYIDDIEEDAEDEINEDAWRSELLETLRNMDPSAFERLTQRLLREAGFTQVEVTGRTGDGGIDGKGRLRLGGFLSFHVLFQCKRYRGSVPVSHIRDFRGAIMGRADKGLFITTGHFTRSGIEEATRDGAMAIDLIDGESLVEKLKELELGVETKIIEVEEITIDKDWFNNI